MDGSAEWWIRNPAFEYRIADAYHVMEDIRKFPNVFSVSYEEQNLTLRFSGERNNLLFLLRYMERENITCGRIFSELPTLNDVFLEITGKELRD